MNKYKVVFEIYTGEDIMARKFQNGSNKGNEVSVEIEAGNKKLATLRAMQVINNNPVYADLYKGIKSVEVIENE